MPLDPAHCAARPKRESAAGPSTSGCCWTTTLRRACLLQSCRCSESHCVSPPRPSRQEIGAFRLCNDAGRTSLIITMPFRFRTRSDSAAHGLPTTAAHSVRCRSLLSQFSGTCRDFVANYRLRGKRFVRAVCDWCCHADLASLVNLVVDIGSLVHAKCNQPFIHWPQNMAECAACHDDAPLLAQSCAKKAVVGGARLPRSPPTLLQKRRSRLAAGPLGYETIPARNGETVVNCTLLCCVVSLAAASDAPCKRSVSNLASSVVARSVAAERPLTTD